MWAQVSDHASDPTSWAELFKVVGPEFGLVILMLVIGLTLAFLIGLLLYRIANWVLGPDGWGKMLGTKWVERQDAFLSKIEQHLPAVEQATKAQFEFCKRIHESGEPANVEDLRAAGHHFAEIGRAIGDATKAAGVNERADAIHGILRGDIRGGEK